MNPTTKFALALSLVPASLPFGLAAHGQAAEMTLADQALYGPGHKTPRTETLTAGPIRVKFTDGELHYLYVGRREIVRRVYFAVRDKNWNTALPTFTRMDVQKTKGGFTIHLEATCRSTVAESGALVDYRWHGEIVGTPDGRITFTAGGIAGQDFESPRIGLCVLYGADALAGRPFETRDAAGTVAAGTFPSLVSPSLVAGNFQSLRYQTADGLRVETILRDTQFSMEDQRNYGDSSFKAYAPLDYSYPSIKGKTASQEVVTVRVTNASPSALASVTADAPTRVTIGGLLPGARMPQIGPAGPSAREADFGEVNGRRRHEADARAVTWSFCPAVHLPDDDNFMDNAVAIKDQVETAHSFAPQAAIRIEPISLDLAHPTPAGDPRTQGLFAGAWLATVLQNFALAGGGEAGLHLGAGRPADAVARSLGRYSGHVVRETTVVWAGDPTTTSGHAPVRALAVDDAGKPVLWLINVTARPQRAVVVAPTGVTEATLHETTMPGAARTIQGAGGQIPVPLSPFAVCEVHFIGG